MPFDSYLPQFSDFDFPPMPPSFGRRSFQIEEVTLTAIRQIIREEIESALLNNLMFSIKADEYKTLTSEFDKKIKDHEI
jgi:hypothetical protein